MISDERAEGLERVGVWEDWSWLGSNS